MILNKEGIGVFVMSGRDQDPAPTVLRHTGREGFSSRAPSGSNDGCPAHEPPGLPVWGILPALYLGQLCMGGPRSWFTKTEGRAGPLNGSAAPLAAKVDGEVLYS